MRRYRNQVLFIIGLVLTVFVFILSTGMAETHLTERTDGEYEADGFSWSGGTGRLKSMECSGISIRNGCAYATITIGSRNYSYIRVGDEIFECENGENDSTAEIPVNLNSPTRIMACTTAMSVPHEIEYEILIQLGEDISEKDSSITIAGERFETDSENATDRFILYHGENGELIKVRDIGYYYICIESESITALMRNAVKVVVRPVKNAYIAVPAAAKYLAEQAAEGVRFVADGDIALENGWIDVGEPDKADYRTLLLNGCDFAVVGSESEAVNLEEMGITVFVDESSEKEIETEQWKEVYHLLFEING